MKKTSLGHNFGDNFLNDAFLLCNGVLGQSRFKYLLAVIIGIISSR